MSATVFGLYRLYRPNDIEMLAPDQATARTMCTRFGAAWRARKLTEAEVATPEVQAEIQSLRDEGAWS
jgi:hypothetical protein